MNLWLNLVFFCGECKGWPEMCHSRSLFTHRLEMWIWINQQKHLTIRSKNMALNWRECLGACALWTFMVNIMIWQTCMLDTSVSKGVHFKLHDNELVFKCICLNLTVYFWYSILNIALLDCLNIATFAWDRYCLTFAFVQFNNHASMKHLAKCPCISLCHYTQA